MLQFGNGFDQVGMVGSDELQIVKVFNESLNGLVAGDKLELCLVSGESQLGLVDLSIEVIFDILEIAKLASEYFFY